jgi:hypothetical protein
VVAWSPKSRKPPDAALVDRKHRLHNRRYWQSRRLPCARCGGPIDYFGRQFLSDGKANPRYLVVGHKVSRVEAAELGWSLLQVNDLTNTQPECYECSVKSGAVLGRDRAQAKAATPKPSPISAPEAEFW